MNPKIKPILVGIITSAHGITGNILVKSFTKPAFDITSLPLVNQENTIIKLKLLQQTTKGALLCKIEGLYDRNSAEKLRGTKIFCLSQDLPTLPQDEFYAKDLVGLSVINEKSDKIGIVTNICNFGAGDIIEIKFNNGTLELLPFSKEIFAEITEEYVKLATNMIKYS